MVEKVTGIGNIEESRIQEFLINIDEDKNGTVQREELSDFIQRGISMTAKEKEEYASRGELQDIMIAFFNGVDEAKDVFTENGREGLDQYFEDQSEGSLQMPEIIAYVQVKDLTNTNKDDVFVFNGWMFSSSPSIAPFDHPVYDIWLVKCY